MTHARDDAGEAGFTLIEMLVVFAILVIVTAIGSLSLGAVRGRQIAETTRTQIVSALKLARLRAIQEGSRTAVVFDPDNRSVSATGSPPIVIDPRVQLRVVSSSKVEQQGNPAIVFLSDGRSSGGSVEITLDGDSRVVTVDWLTGTVREGTPE